METNRKLFKIMKRKQAYVEEVKEEEKTQEEESYLDLYCYDEEEIIEGFKRMRMVDNDEDDDYNKKSKQDNSEIFKFEIIPIKEQIVVKSELEKSRQNNKISDEVEIYATASTNEYEEYAEQNEIENFICGETNYLEQLNWNNNSVRSKKQQIKKNKKLSQVLSNNKILKRNITKPKGKQ